jgi:hypothetical protein
MRTFALLLLIALPPLLICGTAYAKSSTDFSKPVCSHYDDSAKAASASADTTTAPAATNPAAPVAVAAATSATPPVKSGGTAHVRSAPRWQTFLPGMFR